MISTPYKIINGKRVYKVKRYLDKGKKRYRWVMPKEKIVRNPIGDATI